MNIFYFMNESCEFWQQLGGEPSEVDIALTDDGFLDIFRFEPERGFTRAVTGFNDSGMLAITSWERVAVWPSVEEAQRRGSFNESK